MPTPEVRRERDSARRARKRHSVPDGQSMLPGLAPKTIFRTSFASGFEKSSTPAPKDEPWWTR